MMYKRTYTMPLLVRLQRLGRLLLRKIEPIQIDQLLSIPRLCQVLGPEEVAVLNIQVEWCGSIPVLSAIGRLVGVQRLAMTIR